MKRFLSLFMVMLFVVSLTACGELPAEEETMATEAAATEKKAEDITTTEEKEEVAESSEPSIFTYSIASDPPTLDPQLNSSGDAVTINSCLFEGLVVTDEYLQPQPGVAESWEISDDGLVYTFYLREDAHWSDGTAITAEDFVYSWRRVLDPALGAKYANHLFYLKNGEAYYNGEASVEDIGVEAIDDYTLLVTLESPTSYMMELFARNAYAPVDKDTVEANPENWAAHTETCLSNGAFIMKEYALNEYILLEKDPNYWNADAIKIDQIKYVFIGDSTTALAAFEAGEIDGTSSLPSAEIPMLLLTNDELHVRERLSTRYVIFNNEDELMSNAKVREALSKAIDRTLITDNITMGGETPATGFIPYGMIVDGEDFRETAGDYGIETTAMVEEAQAILAEAGYPNGEGWPDNVELMYSDNDLYKSLSEALQQMWKENLNIDVELVSVEGGVSKSRRNDGDFMITISGWGADYANPMTFLDMWVSESGNNYARYYNEEFDEIMRQARTTSDISESNALLYEAEKLTMGEDFIIAPLHYRTRNLLISDDYTGWYINSLGKYYFMYVDKQ